MKRIVLVLLLGFAAVAQGPTHYQFTNDGLVYINGNNSVSISIVNGAPTVAVAASNGPPSFFGTVVMGVQNNTDPYVRMHYNETGVTLTTRGIELDSGHSVTWEQLATVFGGANGNFRKQDH